MNTPSLATLAAHYYRDPAIYARERRAIFARSWQLLAHESQLERSGTYVAATLAGYPLLVVRGEDGAVRAFHNVCRHRAGPLVDEGHGECGKALLCRYHGWRYGLDGRLASARDFGAASDFDVRDFGLIALQCRIWRGFIFANMDTGDDTFEAFIGPLEAKAHDLRLDGLRLGRQSSHQMRCNWKTYVENYLEGYHIPIVHPGLNAVVDAQHYEVEVAPPVIFHHAPPRADAPVAGLWAWAWPSLGVNIYADGVLMERMWPLDNGHTRLDYLFLVAQDAAPEDLHRSVAASEATTIEDIVITEAVQRNLDAGIYETGRLSPKHEAGVAWFQARVRSALELPS